MSKDKTLIPAEQKFVEFHGDQLIAVLVDGEPYVPIRPLCDYLELSWSGQRERVLRDDVLSEAAATVRVTRTEGEREVARELLALPLKYLNGWLFGVNARRVKDELRSKLIQYQKECYEVLAQAFQARAATSAGSSLANIRDMALAIAEMADQQIVLEGRISTTESRLDQAAIVVGDIRKRLKTVEGRVRPDAYITDEQASEVSLQVRALANLIGGHYQTVFSALYRRFGVGGYKFIRIEQYEAVLAFLEEWRQSEINK
jgi:hypothetical protein